MTTLSPFTLSYDSVRWHSLPMRSYVELYADGLYQAPATAPALLQAIDARWITVTGDYRTSSIIDWEQGNPCFTAIGLRGFVRGRLAERKDAIIYVDRANAADALAALADSGHGDLGQDPGVSWWIPTLDGVQWTAADLAADLAGNWHAPIPAAKLWGNQWLPGGYDTTDLYRAFR